jgi:hypothetical protein
MDRNSKEKLAESNRRKIQDEVKTLTAKIEGRDRNAILCMQN